MSCVLSPVVSSTRPTCSPSASTTSQPGSMRNQETGVSSSDTCLALDGLASDVPDRALRCARLRVGERVEDPYVAWNPRLVEAGEAAPAHLGRRAVAEAPCDPEAERRRTAEAGWVERRQQHRSALEVVARAQLELAVEIAPVVGQRREQPVPVVGEARRCPTTGAIST